MNNPKQLDRDLSLIACLEALLFVSPVPVTVAQLASVLNATNSEIEAGLIELEAIYNENPQLHGIRLQKHRGKYQLTTAAQLSSCVERFFGLEEGGRTSAAALETLAIILYLQPVTRPQIDSIRGVSSDSVIRSLLRKGLIQEEGRSESPGRPILYGTTPDLLQHLGINSVEDLPEIRIEDLKPDNRPRAISPKEF